jgi:hypothetical protein
MSKVRWYILVVFFIYITPDRDHSPEMHGNGSNEAQAGPGYITCMDGSEEGGRSW